MTISSSTPGQPEETDPRVFAPAEPEVVFQSPYTAPPAPRRRLGGVSAASLLLALAAVVAIAGVAFAVGRTTADGSSGNVPQANANAGNGTLPGGGAVPGNGLGEDQGRSFGDEGARIDQTRSVTGTVTSVSGSTLTVQLADGRTVQVTLDSSTTYHSEVAASRGDVASGSKVIVSVSGLGNPGDDAGSVTATDVTIAGS